MVYDSYLNISKKNNRKRYSLIFSGILKAIGFVIAIFKIINNEFLFNR